MNVHFPEFNDPVDLHCFYVQPTVKNNFTQWVSTVIKQDTQLSRGTARQQHITLEAKRSE